MDKNQKNELRKTLEFKGQALYKSAFTGRLTGVIIKVSSAALSVVSLVIGVCTGTWHNVMFSGMFLALYFTIRNQEGK